MNLHRDISSRPILYLKGLLFLVIGVLSAGALYFQMPALKTLLLLVLAVWGFCRFYYFLFYVLENYAESGRKYAGIWDLLKSLLTRR